MMSSPTSITIRVFARYADLLGMNEVTVPLGAGPTVRDVVAYVRRLPGGASLPDHVLVAVNHAQASLDARVAPGDEVALLPPMAGG